ncbi:replication initiation protein RepM [Acinetobacter variabilis]|uniref:replication initiation protein RepM n=1 Tax=Acinetobacter variabilis TaxID=70346 RepID=UPI0021C1D1A6|nr:replication initiation protein RepM [Acinetobacter variabilis]UXI53223.1 replication initiation protein RepM [Acinetobacter variabilis]
MKNSLVVKDNALINASYNLELTEQRLIMLAIINARESGQGITADSKLEIHASDYSNLFNVSIDASYKALREAVNNLFNRQFSYTAEYKRTGKTGVVRSRWVSRIFYVDDLALLEITFAPDVVPLVTRLEEHFTSYQAKQVAHLTSKYATRLYELLIAWREVGKVPQIEISAFRNRLGLLENEYTAMSDFKKRVLEPSIKQINEHTDITVTYEQHKKGRLISGFSFKLKQKQSAKKIEAKRDPNTPDFFIKMTDAQRHLFANKMSEMPEMSKYSQGTESYQQFAIRIADMLLEPKKFRELYPILEKLGCQP